MPPVRRNPKSDQAAGTPIALPDAGRVYAIIVGIETYRERAGGQTLKSVDFARNDADGFADVLLTIYGEERVTMVKLLDNSATIGEIRYETISTIEMLTEDDLFVFYYAGHGFHGVGGNRITCWDSNALNVGATTLLLRALLFDPLAQSRCKRSLTFIDACASAFKDLVVGRDAISDLDQKELREFRAPDRYSGIFLSCEPGQASYPAQKHQHGIWTHFLLRALNGDEEALDSSRYVTDVGLRDYLARQVPRFITTETQIRGAQRPQAIITAPHTFAIRFVPEPVTIVAPEGDLSGIRIAPTKEYFERVQSRLIKSLPGFDKKRGHFVPTYHSEATSAFVRTLVADDVNDELQQLYENAKSTFGWRHRDVRLASDGGEGSLDTELFRFSITVRQRQSKPDEYSIVRRLSFREDAMQSVTKIDEVFGPTFERIVISGPAVQLDFDELVDIFEDIKDAYGGDLEIVPASNRVAYTGQDGTRLNFYVDKERITLGAGQRMTCSGLLSRAHRYRFGLTGPSRLLLK